MSKLSLGSIQTLTLRTLENLVFVSLKKGINESEERREAGDAENFGHSMVGGIGCTACD